MKNIFAFLILLTSSVFCQNDFDAEQFIDETPKFVFNIQNWESSDYLKLGIITASTFALIQTDQSVREFIYNNNLNDKSAISEFGKAWGEPVSTIPISIGFYLHGLIANDKTTKRIGFEIFQSFIYTGAITALLKSAIGRARPYKNLSSKYFRPFIVNNDFNSLPSGHTAVAFSLSTVLANNLDSDYLKVLAFTPAFITAYSRMVYDKHWLSDVFLASALGYFIGNFVHDIHTEFESPNETFYNQNGVMNVSIKLNLYKNQ